MFATPFDVSRRTLFHSEPQLVQLTLEQYAFRETQAAERPLIDARRMVVRPRVDQPTKDQNATNARTCELRDDECRSVCGWKADGEAAVKLVVPISKQWSNRASRKLPPLRSRASSRGSSSWLLNWQAPWRTFPKSVAALHSTARSLPANYRTAFSGTPTLALVAQ
jgi:hypothetical protein